MNLCTCCTCTHIAIACNLVAHAPWFVLLWHVIYIWTQLLLCDASLHHALGLHLQSINDFQFADNFYSDPRYCSLPEIPLTDGIPNRFSSSKICPDSSGEECVAIACGSRHTKARLRSSACSSQSGGDRQHGSSCVPAAVALCLMCALPHMPSASPHTHTHKHPRISSTVHRQLQCEDVRHSGL